MPFINGFVLGSSNSHLILRVFTILLGGILLIGLNSCSNQSVSTYERDQLRWRAERLSELKSPYSWPSVVGLFPLEKSITYLGSAPANEILIQQNAPSSLGYVRLEGEELFLNTYKNLGVKIEGTSDHKASILTDMDDGGPTKAYYKSLEWYIIQRQNQYFLRVKDTLSVYRANLVDIPYYDIDESFRVRAQFTPADSTEKMAYKNILGMNFNVNFAGTLKFKMNGTDQALLALPNNDGKYFVIFSDMTSGEDTYGGGRYMYPNEADSNGETWLDFNMAINPPCVFTPYATCPLPPTANHLDFEVTAGEKYLKLF